MLWPANGWAACRALLPAPGLPVNMKAAGCRPPLLPFASSRTIFNGNGKLPAELELAVEHGVLINVDSEFDLANIQVRWEG